MLSDRFFRIGSLLLLLLAGLVYLLGTVNGPGLMYDSVAYLDQARAIAGGDSIFNLGTHYPPGVALLWSPAAGVFHTELLWIRVIGGISLLIVLLSLTAVLLREQVSPLNTLLTALLAMVVAGFSLQFWMGLSEAPMLAVLAVSILLVQRIGSANVKLWHWLALAACLALMLLLRYAAVPLVGGLLLALLASKESFNWQRFGQLVVVGLISILPVGLWLIVSAGVAEQGAARAISYHPPDAEKLAQLQETLSGWAGLLPAVVMLVVIALVVAAAIVSPILRQRLLVRCCLFLMALYAAFIALSVTFFDAHTPLDIRILSPFFLPLLCLIAMVCQHYLPRGAAFVLAAWVLLSLPDFAQNLSRAIAKGYGYTAVGIAEMQVLKATEHLDKAVPIYSNSPELFYLYQDRPALALPLYYNPVSMRRNPRIAEEWEAVLADMRENDGIVVWSPLSDQRIYLPTVEDMLSFGDLRIRKQYADGTILELIPSGEPGSPPELESAGAVN